MPEVPLFIVELAEGVDEPENDEDRDEEVVDIV